MRPVICLITDRARVGGADALVALVDAAVSAGVDLVQLRERDLDGGPLTELAVRCVRVTSGSRTRVLVNDRLDVAMAAGAHGVHLRGDSFSAVRARSLSGGEFLIGRSVHNVEEARQVSLAGGADYLVFGTVFPTSSKRGRGATGVGELAEVVRTTPLPVLAVGGVTAATVTGAAQAGAAGVAAIGWFADGGRYALRAAVDSAARAFDTRRGGSLP